MGEDLHAVAVGVDGNTTVAQLAGLAGAKLVKKLRLSSGVVLSDLETQGAWLDPDDQLWLLETAHGLSVEAQVVGLADDDSPSGLVKDVMSWRALADDEGHWLHDVAGRYGFSCTVGSPNSGHLADLAATTADVHDVLEQLAQPTEPQDEKIDFWADEAMLILEQLRLGQDPLESEDTAVMPDTETAAQIGDWLAGALAGTDDVDEGQDEEEQWGGIILDGEEEELYWAQHEAEMAARAAGELSVDDEHVEAHEVDAHTADSQQDAETEMDAVGALGTDGDDDDNDDALERDSASTPGKAEDPGASAKPARSRRRKRSQLALEDKRLAGQDASAAKADENGCTTFACHYACPPGTKKTGLNQNCCGDGLCLNIENEERCPVDCAGVIVNGMLGPGTYIDPSPDGQKPLSMGMDDADERVPMAREEAGTMMMQDGKQALPVVWVQKSRINEYRAQGFRTLENLLGTDEPMSYTPHPQHAEGLETQQLGIPFDPTKTTQANVQAQAMARMRHAAQAQGGDAKRAWSTQMPTKLEIEQSKALARRAAGAIQCNTCLFLLQDLWGKVLGVGANTAKEQAVHRAQFGTENDIIAAVEKMCGPQGSAAPFRGAYLLEEAKDCKTHPRPGCGHEGFSLRRRQPPLPADIVPLSWRTDALKLACNDLSNALDIDIAEKFYSLTNGKALYQLSRDEMKKLKDHEKDMIVDLCSERCVGLTIRSSQAVVAPPAGSNGRVVHTSQSNSAAQQQHRLNQINQPTRQSDGGIHPRRIQQQQIVDNAKLQHTQSAMHASVIVNAAINAAKHNQVPDKQKAKTVLDALEHRTQTAAWARQQQERQEKQEKAQAALQLQRKKRELERRTGQQAAAKLLKSVTMVVGGSGTEQQTHAGVSEDSEQLAKNKPATGDLKQLTRERTGAAASDSAQKPRSEQVSEDDDETSSGNDSNKKKEKKDKRTNKVKMKRGRKKTATEEL